MKLWSGRFTKDTDGLVNDFHSSIRFDKRLFKEDIKGSIAHVKMLGKQGIIELDEAKLIEEGLNAILSDINNDLVEFDINAEDIHMNVEKMLINKIGDVGKKVHTGRSRNDQVALDLRMYVKNEIKDIKVLLSNLILVLLDISKDNADTIMPGYTHLQKAQPITLAHHLMAYVEMLHRDDQRLMDCYKRTNVLPLGSGALASTTYPIDRQYVATLLDFDAISLNSMDAVSDRDFCIELLNTLSIIMMHLSRFCEEIILWCSDEFNFIKLDDAYSTGSSIMPQKKNPDVAELIRGKTGRVYGSLMGLLTTMKGIPLAYNKDMQEDKEQLFDAIDTVKMSMDIFGKMLSTTQFNKQNMYKGASGGFTNATDAADYLVKKGMAFRDAHAVIGKLVLHCLDVNKPIDDLSIEELQIISPMFEEDIYEHITLEACVNGRNAVGGPAKTSVLNVIEHYSKIYKD